MRTNSIREKLHQFIDKVEDKKAKAIYTLFEEEIEDESGYSDEFKAELDSRASYYYNGGKMVEPDELDKQVEEILLLSRKSK